MISVQSLRHRATRIAAIVVVSLTGIAGCDGDEPSDATNHSTVTPSASSREAPESEALMKSPEEVQSEFEATWMALPNVIGVGVGEQKGRPCLMVFASAPHEAHASIPDSAGGYPVRVDVVGDVKAGEN